MMRSLWRTMALIWLGGIASPALMPAAAETNSPGASAPTGAVELIGETYLVGSLVTDRDGRPSGILRDLLIDPKTGVIGYALIGSDGTGFDIGDSVVAVPWQLFPVGARGRTLRTGLAAAQLTAAPRLAEASLRVAPSGAALAKSRAAFGLAPPAAPDHLGRASRMVGAVVYGKGGSGMVGEVDQLLVDWSGGRIAWCAVARDQGLRIWTPVPMAALSWSPDLAEATLSADHAVLDKAPGLFIEPVDTHTTEAKLRALYATYGVPAYR